MEIVCLKNIVKRYHTNQSETEAIHDVSFAVNKKEFVSIIGPSGCGKSTLLSMIAGLEAPSSGEILLPRGKNVTGYMLQQDHLFPWLTVRQNALLGPTVQHDRQKETKERVDRLLAQYDLDGFADAYPAELSGGMRQRAALIRTLATDPELLLLDEPFSALDSQTRLAVSDDIHTIIKGQGKTAILVTHDISEAISMSDRILVLSSRPATVKHIHTIALDPQESPLARRKDQKFSAYFEILWEELHGYD